MNRKLTLAAMLVSSLLIAGQAYADCGESNADAQKLLQTGKTLESQGNKQEALFKYQAATGYFCEQVNPYAPEAAKRAAPLGMELGTAAEKRGDFEKALQLFEAGGHYAAADRVLMQLARAKPDNVDSWQRASTHFRHRAEGAFRSNNEAVLKVTGPYAVDAKLVAEVSAMPAKALERAIQKEAAAFNEQYLREYVQVAQSAPDDQTDAAAVQRYIGAHQAFAQKWKNEDLMKVSRDTLNNLQYWGYNSQDPQYANTVATQVARLVEIRATSLRTKFYAAPKLLEDAQDYYRVLGSENTKLKGQLAAVRSQASQLGDEANAKQRYALAVAYYKAADEDAKAKAVEERQRALAMQKMQPSIDQARKQAEAIQKEYSDPAKVAAMKQQAEAARQAMQADQAASKAKNKKAADDLEKELGL
jgi:hypothetical protein